MGNGIISIVMVIGLTIIAMKARSLKGIDVSQWQESIDWTAVKKDGIQFAFIRVAHGSEHKLDTYYNQNMTNAIAAGIPRRVFTITARPQLKINH